MSTQVSDLPVPCKRPKRFRAVLEESDDVVSQPSLKHPRDNLINTDVAVPAQHKPHGDAVPGHKSVHDIMMQARVGFHFNPVMAKREKKKMQGKVKKQVEEARKLQVMKLANRQSRNSAYKIPVERLRVIDSELDLPPGCSTDHELAQLVRADEDILIQVLDVTCKTETGSHWDDVSYYTKSVQKQKPTWYAGYDDVDGGDDDHAEIMNRYSGDEMGGDMFPDWFQAENNSNQRQTPVLLVHGKIMDRTDIGGTNPEHDPDHCSVLLHVGGFKPYMYARVPVHLAEYSAEALCGPFKRAIENILDQKDIKDATKPYILDVCMVQKASLYDYQHGKLFPHLHITVSLPSIIDPLCNILCVAGITVAEQSVWGDQKHILQCFDASVSLPLRAMFNLDWRGNGWIRVPRGTYHKRIHNRTLYPVELESHYSTIQALSPNDHGEMAPIIAMSFDNEMAAPKGKFPNSEVDPIITIAGSIQSITTRTKLLDFVLTFDPPEWMRMKYTKNYSIPVPLEQSSSSKIERQHRWWRLADDEEFNRLEKMHQNEMQKRRDKLIQYGKPVTADALDEPDCWWRTYVCECVDEAHMLEVWASLIRKYDVDIITGMYEISMHGFVKNLHILNLI